MLCDRCGAENEDSLQFCENCGAKLESVRESCTEKFCVMCGKELSQGVKFCEYCGFSVSNQPVGGSYSQTSDKTEELLAGASAVARRALDEGKKGLHSAQQQISGFVSSRGQQNKQYTVSAPASMQHEPLARVQYKMSGSTVNFYEDCLEYDGKILLYKDIKTVTSEGSTTVGYATVIVYSYSESKIVFMMRDGARHKLGLYGFNLYGIGTTRSATDRWRELNSAVEEYVVKPMARDVINRIKNGGLTEISYLEIINGKVIAEPSLFRRGAVITKENFGRCYSTEGYIIFEDKTGKKLFEVLDDEPNAMLLPYVIPEIL